MDAGDDIDFSELEDLGTINNDDHLISFFAAGVCEGTAEHTTCTHAHICVDPPVDDDPSHESHPHTCVHIHAHATTVAAAAPLPPPDAASPSAGSSKTKPLTPSVETTGNRAAVKKYRNKKKAQAASLEKQVQNLTALTQQLMGRVAELEADKRLRDAELNRFRCLLVEFRGRIDGEIGAAAAFPIQNQNNLQVPASVHHGAAFLGISRGGSCDFRCNNPGPGIVMMQGTSSGHQVVLGQQGACLPVCSEGMMDTGPAGCNIQPAENN